MNKEIIFLEESEFDLMKIKVYHNSFNKIYSLKLIKKIIQTIDILKQYPNFGKICEENYNFRELNCGRYRILYKNENGHIVIHRVLDSKMDFN